MNNNKLRQDISEFLGFKLPRIPIPLTVSSEVKEDGYTRYLISYFGDDEDAIPAYLLLPDGKGPFASILIHHQHHGQRHFGKSEVCGLVGDPLQSFGPAFAKRGIAVLAPDSICFEDRRTHISGTDSHKDDDSHHYNEMAYRLLRGDTLMRKVLDDSARGISVLEQHPAIDSKRIGTLGHSYGGNTVLFHSALDTRIRYLAASGAASSYQYKLSQEIGIEMAEIIPGFAAHFDIQDLVKCIAPRRALLVSATEDSASMDADKIVKKAMGAYKDFGMAKRLQHIRYEGSHSLTRERFTYIVGWLASNVSKTD